MYGKHTGGAPRKPRPTKKMEKRSLSVFAIIVGLGMLLMGLIGTNSANATPTNSSSSSTSTCPPGTGGADCVPNGGGHGNCDTNQGGGSNGQDNGNTQSCTTTAAPPTTTTSTSTTPPSISGGGTVTLSCNNAVSATQSSAVNISLTFTGVTAGHPYVVAVSEGPNTNGNTQPQTAVASTISFSGAISSDVTAFTSGGTATVTLYDTTSGLTSVYTTTVVVSGTCQQQTSSVPPSTTPVTTPVTKPVTSPVTSKATTPVVTKTTTPAGHIDVPGTSLVNTLPAVGTNNTPVLPGAAATSMAASSSSKLLWTVLMLVGILLAALGGLGFLPRRATAAK